MKNSTLNFLGSDAGFGENNNSAYIETENKFILIDCGITVFNKIKNFDFSKYNEIEIIITHLHNDHAGSLSQFILYLWFVYNKKAKVISACENIAELLKITGTTEGIYTIENQTDTIKFIKTEHAKELDCYGFQLQVNGKTIVYTGDTKTLEPFLQYIENADELYVDVSKNGGVHLKYDDIESKLSEIQNKGTKVVLMHLDDRKYIEEKASGKFELA